MLLVAVVAIVLIVSLVTSSSKLSQVKTCCKSKSQTSSAELSEAPKSWIVVLRITWQNVRAYGYKAEKVREVVDQKLTNTAKSDEAD